MKSNRVKIWVSPAFRKVIKKKAADEGTSVIDLSEKIAKKGLIKKVDIGDIFKNLI